MKLICWNMAHRPNLWQEVLSSEADVALLQEACAPPPSVAERIGTDGTLWRTTGAGSTRQWRAAIIPLSGAIGFEPYVTRAICDAASGELPVSCEGTLAAAKVEERGSGEIFTLVSMYAMWERPHASAEGDWIYADGSAHRLISDLSAFIGRQRRHRIIAAGDLNILYGHGEHGSEYWSRRYQTVFDRFAALGLRFVGPQAPNGRQADPWPDELPPSSRNVPTYHTTRQTPQSATRQLDFVFASEDIADRVMVRALNLPDEWGGSDHCRLAIDVQTRA